MPQEGTAMINASLFAANFLCRTQEKKHRRIMKQAGKLSTADLSWLLAVKVANGRPWCLQFVCRGMALSYAGDSVLVFAREGRQCRPACVTMSRTRVRKLQVCTRSVHLCVIHNLTPKVSENNRSRPLMLHVGCGKWERVSQWSQRTALHSGCRSD